MNDPIVGIDLGTSNSVVAHVDATGAVKVLADDAGYKIHPSVVSFHPNGGVVVGAAAKQRKVIDPSNTIYSVKRLIGRGFRSPEVQTALTRVPYQIKEGANQLPMIATRGGEFAVPEISAIVLDYMRNIAAARLGVPIQRAVVTVPAAFNEPQRSASATAGAIAGLTVVRVLNEPTAAALAYGHSRNLRETIAVYDFGGGTFDITILKLEDEVYEVLGTAGDTFLGGDDLDERLVDKMVAKFLAENRIDLRTNEVSMMRLRAVAEQTKIELSRRSRAVVRVDEIAYGAKGVPLNLQIEITRDEFVKEVADIIDRTFPVCQEALTAAGLGIDKINDIILVGGTTKIPYVRDQVSKFFAKAPRSDVNPEDAVAIGASLQAMSLERILARPRRPSSKEIPIVKAPGDEETTNAQPLTVDVLELADSSVTGDTMSLLGETSPGASDSQAGSESVETLESVDTVERDEPSGATMAPSELALSQPPVDPRAKRSTSGYVGGARTATGEINKPDTSYSVTRGGTRDTFERKPGQTGEMNAAMPIGRFTRDKVPTPPPLPVAPPPAAPGAKTMFGVPAGPAAAKPDLSTGVPPHVGKMPTSRGQAPLVRPPAPPGRDSATQNVPSLAAQSISSPATTAPGMGPQSTTLPRLPKSSDDEWSINDQQTRPAPPEQWNVHDHQTKPADPPPGWGSRRVEAQTPTTPSTTQPLAPAAPIAAPTSPTMIAQHGLGPAGPNPSAASTAKGLGMGPALALFESGVDLEDPDPPTTPPSAPLSAFETATPPPTPAPLRPAPPVFGRAPTQPPQRLQLPPQPSQPLPIQKSQPVPRAAPNARTAYIEPSQPLPSPYAAVPVPAPPSRPPVVLELTPRGLGIATVAGYCEELIRRNSRLPIEMKKLFTTSRDLQDVVRIVVCQGESRRMESNVVIGDLVLQNLPRRPRGETSIEVTFTVDASGILQVRARDSLTGTEQSASLDLIGGMPDVSASRDRIQQLRR